MKDNLRLGTCTWNYDSWVGLVYSKAQRTAADYLAEYAEHFDTAEIDSWFYRIPDKATVLDYVSAVPSDFSFTCKAPQELTLTHHRPKKRGDALEPNQSFLSVERFEQFLAAIEPILPQMDAIMFEFEYLNKQKMSGQAELMDRLGEFLRKLPSGIHYAVEPRNGRYLTDQWFQFLLEHNVAHVFSQKIYMPNVWELYEEHRSTIERMPRAVMRLMGGDRKEIERKTGGRWNAVVEPREEENEKIAGMIASYITERFAIVNANNHYEGSAPLTVQSLRELLDA